ncbi:hypothetical protein F66182_481 [Fusarium sp. NRRL 66182]|nr:hypothetical protein F66182_481 [Fusarium sp. NRRL 66182]
MEEADAEEDAAPILPDKPMETLVRTRGREWIDDCFNKSGIHQGCDIEWFKQDVNPPCPTRLIDLDIGDSNKIRIVVPKEDCVSKSYQYLTLSYRWGTTNESAKTTRATIASRREGFDMATLPKTIRDAIQLTRLLGFRYLWIDAICIIQSQEGDEYLDDWNNEAPRIGSYYLHSHCLLSASGASDSSEGLFMEPTALRYQLKTCALAFDKEKAEYICRGVSIPEPNLSSHWHNNALRERGWCLQEEILSPRTLHWSRYALFWQCHSLERAFPHSGHDQEIPGKYGFSFNFNLEPEQVMGNSWVQLVRDYLYMHLTYETDRLVGIQGLADRLVTLHGGEYFAGVFRSHVARGLLWNNLRTDGSVPISPGVPTWSWASRPPAIWFPRLTASLVQDTKQDVFPKDRRPVHLDHPSQRIVHLEAPLLTLELGEQLGTSDGIEYRPTIVTLTSPRSVADLELGFGTYFGYDEERLVPKPLGQMLVLLLGVDIQHSRLAGERRDEEIVVDPGTQVAFRGIILRYQGRFYTRVGRVDLVVLERGRSYWELKQEVERHTREVCLV